MNLFVTQAAPPFPVFIEIIPFELFPVPPHSNNQASNNQAHVGLAQSAGLAKGLARILHHRHIVER